MDVLIVDDDVDLAIAEMEALSLEGHTVRVAHHGEEGLAALRVRLPDVILLDVEMPVLDGPSMAHRMFIDDAGKEEIPIVLTSGYARLGETAAAVGTPYVMAKPYGIDRLLAIACRAARERIAPRGFATRGTSRKEGGR